MPDPGASALVQLSQMGQLPPWYSGERMTVMRRLLVNPDGTPTDMLRAMQERLCARNAAWDDCIQFPPRRFAVTTKERYAVEHKHVGAMQSMKHHGPQPRHM
eukprot:11106511-Alexandrium_andersonii.AAC.1